MCLIAFFRFGYYTSFKERRNFTGHPTKKAAIRRRKPGQSSDSRQVRSAASARDSGNRRMRMRNLRNLYMFADAIVTANMCAIEEESQTEEKAKVVAAVWGIYIHT